MATKYLKVSLSEQYFRKIIYLCQSLGFFQALVYVYQKVRNLLFDSSSPYILLSKDSMYPLWCRPKTSDIDVFRQIFVEREYSCLDKLTNIDLVIDCGANVGYSSAYFLTQFPGCKVICVEPDSSNFLMAERNLAPYKERVRLLRTGIWSHPARLKISEGAYRDGREWTVQVRECKPDEISEMKAIDIGTLLAESGLDRISVLKMDVEGAEAVVFSKNYGSWLSCVDNIVIELHDDSSFGNASEIFQNAISDRPYNYSRSGELTVCKFLDFSP